ncbi:MAG: PqqD family protein [Candidatus Scalindua sp. AMX11]|nr:MAG: PqqD family protein [Candidatus Scalindua sp.]NOG84397.1 PqqD family protein [Planctomycetota bacterium]RZV65752.1 MAG: PqqD family protein [Candidatus Scalindua sp. SCAELEC01]TDE65398.1 MAG: PqqD family protein [Candidatus Scalindua sp. AMX11]GJQ60346.1 MAG: hypothetical protein SCALA701_31470 [Candidatus Scalindua sp.]
MDGNGEFKPIAKEGVDLEELEDGCVLYDTQKDEVHSLNATAAFIWTCCDGEHSVEEITTIVEKCFNSECKTVLKDVIEIVNTFSEKSLLK